MPLFNYNKPFVLECGVTLPQLTIYYETWGVLSALKDNVVWVCHALTANANPVEWWPGLVGEDFIFTPKKHFIVCANIIGSCYGTTGPCSTDILSTPLAFSKFPLVTVKDMVKAHQLLAEYLELHQINFLIGGSLGGQQALEWSISSPSTIKHLILLATNAKHSAWGIAFNQSQRLAILADPTFANDNLEGGKNGLIAARSIALLSYRTYAAYNATQTENSIEIIDNFKASSYQNYQGLKLSKRFNAYSYVILSKAMDSHNIARNRNGVEHALQQITAKTMVLALQDDVLFPPSEQLCLAKGIKNAIYFMVESNYGHDGFLLETKKISTYIQQNFNL